MDSCGPQKKPEDQPRLMLHAKEPTGEARRAMSSGLYVAVLLASLGCVFTWHLPMVEQKRFGMQYTLGLHPVFLLPPTLSFLLAAVGLCFSRTKIVAWITGILALIAGTSCLLGGLLPMSHDVGFWGPHALENLGSGGISFVILGIFLIICGMGMQRRLRKAAEHKRTQSEP